MMVTVTTTPYEGLNVSDAIQEIREVLLVVLLTAGSCQAR